MGISLENPISSAARLMDMTRPADHHSPHPFLLPVEYQRTAKVQENGRRHSLPTRPHVNEEDVSTQATDRVEHPNGIARPQAVSTMNGHVSLEGRKSNVPGKHDQTTKAFGNGLRDSVSNSDSDEDEDDKQYLPDLTSPEDFVKGYGVDSRDEGTSDSWVKRHPELVRLTGRHPFNCEPPLPRLMQHGFVTPTSLHYVRNHGYVPRASFDDWTVEISGLVKRPQTLRMRQIIDEFTPRELPVTLVCAGNRRKEQNMVQQTIGFNWGAAGTGTSVWRGARLCDVLRRCGIYSKKKGGLYVCFEGDEKLPGGGGSKYATSISVDIAMDESRDVLVAYMQNDKPLEPDHGFPVRMIIPGFIGGRMVKWLRRIEITDKESTNHYHYKDNRVLPSHVDSEKANAEGWWYKPDYIINDLNINSVISSPAHAEVLSINATTMQMPYIVKGYAYSGGGRKVIRVEVTVNSGESWMLCKINHPEKPTKYGKYWCWCFWELEVEVLQFIQAKEIAVRAWDSSMNTQPQQLTWNVMGMMNNCWFRVKVNPCKPPEGGLGLIFEHPTRPGNQSGGWMRPPSAQNSEKDGKAPGLSKSFSSPVLNNALRQITPAELKLHSTRESPWIVVHNMVYDCKNFLKDHPGGSDSIIINAGTDCTEEFDAIHSAKAKAMLEEFKIGELATNGALSADSTPENSLHGGGRALSALTSLAPISESSIVSGTSSDRPVALNPKKKVKCNLISKEILSHDVRLFRFDLPSPDHILGLPVGKHVFVIATVGGKLCMRAYTPSSSGEEVGYFELLIKVYFSGPDPKFLQGGIMSQYLDALPIGGSIEVKGPLGHIEYLGKGHYTVEGEPEFMKNCAMLAGGTGITPMYQLIRAILKDPDDPTEISLVYANRTEPDIMLRSELDEWAKNHPNFKVWYVLSRAGDGVTLKEYSRGYINEAIVREHLPPGGAADTTAFLCGPPNMIQSACIPSLEKTGYHKTQIHEF